MKTRDIIDLKKSLLPDFFFEGEGFYLTTLSRKAREPTDGHKVKHVLDIFENTFIYGCFQK